jgi:hypothetical protein
VQCSWCLHTGKRRHLRCHHLLYDYSGFSPEMYQISYPAPGSPELARHVKDLIQRAGLPAAEDSRRGFDHGTFSLLKPIYPEAGIPVVQLSLKQDFSPLEHIKLGEAIAPLRQTGVLILGSGYSYHNMSRFGPTATQPSTCCRCDARRAFAPSHTMGTSACRPRRPSPRRSPDATDGDCGCRWERSCHHCLR